MVTCLNLLDTSSEKRAQHRLNEADLDEVDVHPVVLHTPGTPACGRTQHTRQLCEFNYGIYMFECVRG